MLTTVSDFSRFLEAVLAGKLLRNNVREQMLSAQIAINSKHQFPTLVDEPTDGNKSIRLSYGLAWGLYWTSYGKAFFKEGHDEGWRNYCVMFDEQKTGVLFMTNSSNGEGIFKELLETILKNPYTPIEWEGYTPYDKLPPRPPLPQHQRVTINAKILDHYAGRYGEPPNLILTIRRVGDHLSIQENDETPQELLPESETDFFSTASDDTLTFEVAKDGRVARMILHLGGKDVPANRID